MSVYRAYAGFHEISIKLFKHTDGQMWLTQCKNVNMPGGKADARMWTQVV